jgi:hypothetical protein
LACLPTQAVLLAAGRLDLVYGLRQHGYEAVRSYMALPARYSRPKQKVGVGGCLLDRACFVFLQMLINACVLGRFWVVYKGTVWAAAAGCEQGSEVASAAWQGSSATCPSTAFFVFELLWAASY